ncbi:hypothetical protein D918_00697 [Trichuris suis]|nr:hypothetical protein D918_00697 [Trichuris suis]
MCLMKCVAFSTGNIPFNLRFYEIRLGDGSQKVAALCLSCSTRKATALGFVPFREPFQILFNPREYAQYEGG